MACVWYLFIAIVIIFYLMILIEVERDQRKRLETVVAKLRDKKTLNEQEVEIYMKAKKYNWLTGKEILA